MSRVLLKKRVSDTAKVWKPPRGQSLPRPSIATAVLVIGLLAGIQLLRVHFKSENVLAGYRMATMQEERLELLGEQALLQIEKNTLERLERVERLATADGMIFPGVDQRLFVETPRMEARP